MSKPGRLRPFRRLVLVVALLIAAALAVAAVWGGTADDMATDHVACSEGSSIPEGLDSDDVRLRPFAESSPWNQELPTEVANPSPEDSTSDLTTAFRIGTATGPADQLGWVHSWINSEQYSLPIYQADPCDPVVSFQQDWESEELDGTTLHIPEDAIPATGTDANVLVVQPDGHTLLEMFHASRVDGETWSTGRVELVDLKGTGMGPDNGVRAFGGSAYGGLIRRWEVDPTDPNYRDGTIDHGLAIAVPNSMLYFASGDPDRDERGYGTSLGYVAPATEQDFDSKWAYQGIIPMGSRVVLPASVDIASLGLGPEAESIAVALQRYGGYVVDRAGDGVVTFYAEPGVPATWLDAARKQDGGLSDLDLLRAQLVVVPPS